MENIEFNCRILFLALKLARSRGEVIGNLLLNTIVHFLVDDESVNGRQMNIKQTFVEENALCFRLHSRRFLKFAGEMKQSHLV